MSYRWQELGLGFELRSNDAELLNRAQSILSPGAQSSDRSPDRVWTIDWNGHEAFRVTGMSDDRSLIPVEVPSREAGLLRVEYDLVEHVMRRVPLTSIHGALLSRDGKGVLIVGPSLAGKSTLAVGLWRAGWSLMSDDIALLDPRSGLGYPAPRRVSLRFGSRELVGDELWNEVAMLPSCAETHKGLFFHPHELDGSERIRETQLAGIFFLARRGIASDPAAVHRINSAAAALALVPYAFRVRELSLPDAVAALSPVLGSVPAFDLGRGPLQEMIYALETQLS